MMRSIVACLVLTVSFTCSGTTATADEIRKTEFIRTTASSQPGIEVGAVQGGASPDSGGGSSPVTCKSLPPITARIAESMAAFGHQMRESIGLRAPGPAPTPYGYSDEEIRRATAWVYCRHADGTVTQYLAGLDDSATELLVASARAKLDLATPDVHTSPPRNNPSLVSIPVWFWTDATPTQTTASIPELSATLTATPTTTEIHISGATGNATTDHTTLQCQGTGTPYDPRHHHPTATSDCSHTFDWNATFTIDITTEWNLTWTATNGQRGTLPPQRRTTTIPLTVQQAQAITD